MCPTCRTIRCNDCNYGKVCKYCIQIIPDFTIREQVKKYGKRMQPLAFINNCFTCVGSIFIILAASGVFPWPYIIGFVAIWMIPTIFLIFLKIKQKKLLRPYREQNIFQT